MRHMPKSACTSTSTFRYTVCLCTIVTICRRALDLSTVEPRLELEDLRNEGDLPCIIIAGFAASTCWWLARRHADLKWSPRSMELQAVDRKTRLSTNARSGAVAQSLHQ